MHCSMPRKWRGTWRKPVVKGVLELVTAKAYELGQHNGLNLPNGLAITRKGLPG